MLACSTNAFSGAGRASAASSGASSIVVSEAWRAGKTRCCASGHAIESAWALSQWLSKPASSSARRNVASLETRARWPGSSRDTSNGTDTSVPSAPAVTSQATNAPAANARTRCGPWHSCRKSARMASPITSTTVSRAGAPGTRDAFQRAAGSRGSTVEEFGNRYWAITGEFDNAVATTSTPSSGHARSQLVRGTASASAAVTASTLQRMARPAMRPGTRRQQAQHSAASAALPASAIHR